MPRMSYSNSALAANSFTNLFSGNIHEILAEDSAVNVYAAGSAVGLNATVMVGGEAVIQDQPISRANRFPVIPDDFLCSGAGFAGDKVVVYLRNTTAGALGGDVIVDIEAL